MTKAKKRVHFPPAYITDPLHPISITVVGCGGTGSKLLTELVSINTILLKLGHTGISVIAVDGDYISNSNIGRGEFYYTEEIGMNKAEALINRINLNCGFNWKHIPTALFRHNEAAKTALQTNIIVSCIDKVTPRLSILNGYRERFEEDDENIWRRDENLRPLYFIDCGNSYTTGQVILGTAGNIRQPKGMTKFKCVSKLDAFDKMFSKSELAAAKKSEDQAASCSTYEAIGRQHPFVNKEAAMKAAEIIYALIVEKQLTYHAVFFDLATNMYRFKSV